MSTWRRKADYSIAQVTEIIILQVVSVYKNLYRLWLNNHYGLFILHAFRLTIAFKLTNATFDQFNAKIATFAVKKCSVWLLSSMFTSKHFAVNDIKIAKRHPYVMPRVVLHLLCKQTFSCILDKVFCAFHPFWIFLSYMRGVRWPHAWRQDVDRGRTKHFLIQNELLFSVKLIKNTYSSLCTIVEERVCKKKNLKWLFGGNWKFCHSG